MSSKEAVEMHGDFSETLDESDQISAARRRVSLDVDDQQARPASVYAGSLPPSETGLTDYGDYTDLDAMIKINEEKQRKQRSGDDKWDKE